MKTDDIVASKSMDFAVRIVKLHKYLTGTKAEFVLSKQLLKSGTSIGANIREAIGAQPRADFIARMQIALKEVYETEYWLELLNRTDYLTRPEYDAVFTDFREWTNLLASIVTTTKAGK